MTSTIGLVVALVALGLFAARLTDRSLFPVDDFAAYWAAGQLNLQGGNPYSPEQLLALQVPLGWKLDRADMMWNPPWTLTVIMPFSLLSYSAGRILWLLFQLAVLFVCVDRLWMLYGGQARRRWMALVAMASFAPTLFVLREGQIGALILMGLVGFLWLERDERLSSAGAVASLAAIKPHLIYLFWMALLLHVIRERRWSLLTGLICALVVATGIPLVLNPAVLGQYLSGVGAHPPDYWATPTLGSALRLALGHNRFWLQFLPPLIGAIWLLCHWYRSRSHWRWTEQMPLLIAVSLATSAYGWEYDLVVFIVNAIQVWIWFQAAPGRARTILGWAIYFMVSALALLIKLDRWPAFFFIWLPQALLAWYLAARGWIRED